MTESRRIIVLSGDGVGPEVTTVALEVLVVAAAAHGVRIDAERRLIGGAAIDEEGTPISDETVRACRSADAVVLGAVGGPRWDALRGDQRCEAGLLRIRKELGLFANLRPVRVHPALVERSVIRAKVVRGTDLVVVRELTGGAYFGQPKGRESDESAVDTTRYSVSEVERVSRVAFELAASRRSQLTSVDKANVLATSQLWRDVVTDVARDYPAVAVTHQLVDSCAMKLVQSPRDFDVIVTENLFGDILTDEAAVLSGSLGMLPSASIGSGGPGLYEPIHGSAPDIAGQDRANPIGAILSIAMALRLSLGLPDAATSVEGAVDSVISQGILTTELGGQAGTRRVGDAVVTALGAARNSVVVG